MHEHEGDNERSATGSGDQGTVPIDLLARMGALSERATENLLAPHRLTPPQSRVLQAMHRHGPDLPLPAIASLTGFPLGALTSIMDRLLLRGLVSQRSNPGRGRQITITISPEGTRIILAIEEARAHLLARLMDGFSDDEVAAIGKLAARLEHEVSQAPVDEAEQPDPASGPTLRLIRGDRA